MPTPVFGTQFDSTVIPCQLKAFRYVVELRYHGNDSKNKVFILLLQLSSFSRVFLCERNLASRLCV